MANSYLNIVSFLLTTLLYYIFKPNLTLSELSNDIEYKKYTKTNQIYLIIYLLSVIIVQFLVNLYIISTICEGNLIENISTVGIYTFFPWFFMLGAVIIVLIMKPGFKTVFADVIGYFYVSNSTSKILTDILVNQDIKQILSQNNIENSPDFEKEKEKIEKAADTIVKMIGNVSILINNIVPNNFKKYWSILESLMKPEYKGENISQEAYSKKEQFLELVITRDNVGEAMWYIYTGILVSSLVQLYINTKACVNNPNTLNQNYKKFLEEQKKIKEKQELSTNTVYTLTG